MPKSAFLGPRRHGLSKLGRYESSVVQITQESQIPAIATVSGGGEYWNYVIQRHNAKRRGLHFDLRLADPRSGVAHSWALQNLPGPGESQWAIRQPGHELEYMGFEGKIREGYGAGEVSIHDAGPVKVISADENKVKFLVPEGNTYNQYSLVNIGGGRWKLFNKTYKRQEVKELGVKPKYVNLGSQDRLDPKNPDEIWQPKLDGASALIYLKKGQQPRVFSYRMPKRFDKPIEHTFKILKEEQKIKKMPGKEVIMRGEIIGVDRMGKSVPANELSGILNSSLPKADQTLQERGVTLKVFPFSVEKIDGKAVDDHRVAAQVMEDVISQIDAFEAMPVAISEKEKSKLLNDIQAGGNPLTQEGVVVWNRATMQPSKFKFKQDHDVYIREIFPGGGKYAKRAAGGFRYSMTPLGPIVGEVGTGMSDSERIDMHENPKNWIGRVAVVASTRQMPSGALFQPSFIRLHMDK